MIVRLKMLSLLFCIFRMLKMLDQAGAKIFPEFFKGD
jgi:hypothetical protein